MAGSGTATKDTRGGRAAGRHSPGPNPGDSTDIGPHPPQRRDRSCPFVVLAQHSREGDRRGALSLRRVRGDDEPLADVAQAHLLIEQQGGFDATAAAAPFVFVDDQGDAHATGADLPGESDGSLRFGAPGGAGGDPQRPGELGHEPQASGAVLDSPRGLPGAAGGPAGVAHADSGQACTSPRSKSPLPTPDRFLRAFQPSGRLQQLMKRDRRRWTPPPWALPHRRPQVNPSPGHH